jgi:hypothetical protein
MMEGILIDLHYLNMEELKKVAAKIQERIDLLKERERLFAILQSSKART